MANLGGSIPSVDESAFDEREFRNALGSFATGVSLVTTRGEDGRPYGMTVNSFAAVSLNPPLVLWSLATGSPSAPAFQAANHFAVNVLALNQLELSRHFSHPKPDKFANVAFSSGLAALPLLDGAAAQFECTRDNAYSGGDHIIILGRVIRFSRNRSRTLIFCHGRYHRGVELEPKADADAELSAAWSGLA